MGGSSLTLSIGNACTEPMQITIDQKKSDHVGPGLCPQKDILLEEYRYTLSRMQNDASGNEVKTGTTFVSWPGGVGAPTKIPTGPVTVGGRRTTRRNRKNRKQTRKNRKSRRVNRQRK